MANEYVTQRARGKNVKHKGHKVFHEGHKGNKYAHRFDRFFLIFFVRLLRLSAFVV